MIPSYGTDPASQALDDWSCVLRVTALMGKSTIMESLQPLPGWLIRYKGSRGKEGVGASMSGKHACGAWRSVQGRGVDAHWHGLQPTETTTKCLVVIDRSLAELPQLSKL